MNYYNEHDPKAAAWLRELMAAKLIPAGVVDERSITEIQPHEIDGFTQCHFFAGIGGWSLALELARWPADRPVWTGSCPCQPFSAAGQGKGGSDDRHLWPVFHGLVSQLRPERVFGEQVAQAIGFNWLDGVSADLEAEGYAVGAAVLGAHSVGAPHIRQRLYWVADADHRGNGHQSNSTPRGRKSGRNGTTGGLADMSGERCGKARGGSGRSTERAGDCRESVRVGDPESGGCGIVRDEARAGSGGHAIGTSWSRFGNGGVADSDKFHGDGTGSGASDDSGERIGEAAIRGFWDHFSIVHCRDGKARRFPAAPDGIEPVLQRVVDGFPGSLDNRRAILDALLGFPLAEGILGRVPLLRGYGNAIVPQVAAEFVMAFGDVSVF